VDDRKQQEPLSLALVCEYVMRRAQSDGTILQVLHDSLI
jgi:hypothetical protein